LIFKLIDNEMIIYRKSIKYKGQELLPIEKNAKSVKYLQIDTTSRIVDQPNPERVALWKKLLATKKN